MGYGSAMRDITDGSAIEWTADPANRCGAEYNVISIRRIPSSILHMFVYVHYVEIVLYCIYVCVFPIYPSMACVLRMSTYILGTSRKRSRSFILYYRIFRQRGRDCLDWKCTFTSLYSFFFLSLLSLTCVCSIVMSVLVSYSNLLKSL